MWNWFGAGDRAGASGFEKGSSKAVQASSPWGWAPMYRSVPEGPIAPVDLPTAQAGGWLFGGETSTRATEYAYYPPEIPVYEDFPVVPAPEPEPEPEPQVNYPPVMGFTGGLVVVNKTKYLSFTDTSADPDNTWGEHEWIIKDPQGVTLFTRFAPGDFLWQPPKSALYTITRRAQDQGQLYEITQDVFF